MFQKDMVSTFMFLSENKLPVETVIDFFLAHKALDVYFLPTTCKHSFGYQVYVLCLTEQEGYFSKLLTDKFTKDFQLTRQERYKLGREFLRVEIEKFPIQIKCGYTISDGKKNYIQLKPEYEDCKKVSQNLNRPLIEIYQEATLKARTKLNSTSTRL